MASINNSINWYDIDRDIEAAVGEITSEPVKMFFEDKGDITITPKQHPGTWTEQVIFFKKFLDKLEAMDLSGFRHIKGFVLHKNCNEHVKSIEITIETDFELKSMKSPEEFLMDCDLRGEKRNDEQMAIAYIIWALKHKSPDAEEESK